ncbi:MAG: hypothetical protein HY660_09475 [Armatimonadetes bacterium]|nr:hypothetical protein [Armatimonadota bacterium]
MLARKNLVVDAKKVRRLAALLRTSESEAVRHAVDTFLLESRILAAAARIRARGTFRDPFGRDPRRNR